MMSLNDAASQWTNWWLMAGYQSAMVALAAILLVTLARFRSAQFRYAILLIALVKFAVPPFWQFPTGVLAHAPAIRPPSLNLEHFSEPETPQEADGLPTIAEPAFSEDTTAPSVVTLESPSQSAVGKEPTAELSTNRGRARLSGWTMGICVIHLLGIILLTVRTGLRYAFIHRLVRRSVAAPNAIQQMARQTAERLCIRSKPEVMVSDECDAPFATGVFRPSIILPRSAMELPDAQREIILGHELVHVGRRDLAVGWLEIILGTLWWFHPMMWWLRRKLRQVREDCCDDTLLAVQFTGAEAYCETLIAAASRQTFHSPEPIALGFANTEHPAARRIRRLMNAKLLRSNKLRFSAVAIVIVLGLLLLPGTRPDEAPVRRTSLQNMFGGWKNLPFDPAADELAILEECEGVVREYRSRYYVDGESKLRFDDTEVRETLDDILSRRPDFFYAQHLLATWHRRNGNREEAEKLFEAAFKNAPVILSQRYRTGDGSPIDRLEIEELSIECNRVKKGSLDQSLKLNFVDLTTDTNGEIHVPVYDTVYRLSSRSIPKGYSTEMPRLGFFEAKSRVGQMPEVTAWKSHSRPNFKRSAADSPVLSEAIGTTQEQLTIGANTFRIGRIARARSDGTFEIDEQSKELSSHLQPLPKLTNSAFIDHAIVDLASPDPDLFEVSVATVLESGSKIPLPTFQQAAGVRRTGDGRFHLFALLETLPDTVDLALDVYNFTDAFRMKIPVAESGEWTQDGVTFITDYQGAGQHVGWNSSSGFYGEAKALDSSSELLFRVKGKGRFTLWIVTTDGERHNVKPHGWYSGQLGLNHERIEIPLDRIQHLELRPWMEPQRIYFESLKLPVRGDKLADTIPAMEIPLNGHPQRMEIDDLWPLNLNCRTLAGRIYAGNFSCGRFGCSFEERPEEDRQPSLLSTLAVHTTAPATLEVQAEFLDQQGAQRTLNNRKYGWGEFGSAMAGHVDCPVTELKALRLQLAPRQ